MDTNQPSVCWFITHNIPIWYQWNKHEIEWAKHDPIFAEFGPLHKDRLCCSFRTFSTWTDNLTAHMVKLFTFVWKQRWLFLSSTCMFFNCLVVLPVCVDIVQNRCKQFHHPCGEIICTYWCLQYSIFGSLWYLHSSNIIQGENWVFHLVKSNKREITMLNCEFHISIKNEPHQQHDTLCSMMPP